MPPVKRLAFHTYLRVQALLREKGLMRVRPFWKASRWLYQRLRQDELIDVRTGGHLWRLDTRDRFFTTSLVLTGQHEQWETPIFSGFLAPGMTVVDVGAHVGYYTLLAAKLVGPTGRVYAFEPNPENYALLTQNLRTNGYPDVTAVNCAVTDGDGEAELFVDPLNSGGGRLQAPGHSTVHYRVRATSLDAALHHELGMIDLLKLDVEGSEPLVYDGMQTLLRQDRIARIMMELFPDALHEAGRSPQELLDGFTRYGFRPYQINERTGRLAPATLEDFLARCTHDHGTYAFLLRAEPRP